MFDLSMLEGPFRQTSVGGGRQAVFSHCCATLVSKITLLANLTI
jgi:hypothetical protein